MEHRLRRLLFVVIGVVVSGCFQPATLRLPTCWTRPPDIERVEYQYHDPFPDAQTGPNTGVRPLFYTEQRPQPVRIRELYDGTRIRQPAGAPVPPPSGPPPGSQYPQIVPF